MASILPLTQADLPWVSLILNRPGLENILFANSSNPRHLKTKENAFLLGNHFDETAYLSYIYVPNTLRRRGIASELVKTFIESSRNANIRRILVSGETGKAPGYLQPGVELPHESGALALLQGIKFKELAKAYAMSIELTKAPPIPKNSNWTVRVATEVDRYALHDAILNSIPGEWEQIFSSALSQRKNRVIVASNGDRIGGYCLTNADRFGPIGVLPILRGHGLGSLIAIAALHEMRSTGENRARFTWADEENVPFYQRIGFNIERCFQRLELLL